MSPAKSDEEIIKRKYNISRFFVEQRQIAWVMLIAVCVWGVYSYRNMPQRKDPDTPVKSAVVLTGWPGAKAEKIEQLVTRKVEEPSCSPSPVRRSARQESICERRQSVMLSRVTGHSMRQ